MWFVVIGILLIAVKYFGLGLATVSWLWVLSPFVLAILWWAWADGSGYTKRKAMEKMEQRKQERRRKHLVNMGMDGPGGRAGRK